MVVCLKFQNLLSTTRTQVDANSLVVPRMLSESIPKLPNSFRVQTLMATLYLLFRTTRDKFELRQHLLARGGVWEVLAEQNLMCARNQELCSLDEPLAAGDEVAFFPTVTGG